MDPAAGAQSQLQQSPSTGGDVDSALREAADDPLLEIEETAMILPVGWQGAEEEGVDDRDPRFGLSGLRWGERRMSQEALL